MPTPDARQRTVAPQGSSPRHSSIAAPFAYRSRVDGGGAVYDVAFLLGIDPGTTTGLATVTTAGGVVSVESYGPLEAVRQIEALHAEGRLVGAYVEDARDLPLYARHGRANRGQRDRIARGVGGVDLLTTLYVDLLEALSVPVCCVEPSRRPKWSAKDCERVTGYAGRSNEHGRDALGLVFGRAVPRDVRLSTKPAPDLHQNDREPDRSSGDPMHRGAPHARRGATSP